MQSFGALAELLAPVSWRALLTENIAATRSVHERVSLISNMTVAPPTRRLRYDGVVEGSTEGDFTGTDRFKIVRTLGMGGMGVVYEAIDREQGAPVALKTLRNATPELLARFKNEFRLFQDIRHPNLVALGELICDRGQWFFTMELVRGVDIPRYVRGADVQLPNRDDIWNSPTDTAGPFGPRGIDEQRLRGALRQLATGLDVLHRAGRVHRDIKPTNVLVASGGRVVVLDFGLARELHESVAESSEAIVGTVSYMAPEQAISGSVGPAADWYSVGTMLYELLTGQLPFDGHWMQVLSEKQQKEPPRPSSIFKDVPSDLEQLCCDLLQRDPQRRPSGRGVLRRLGAPVPPESSAVVVLGSQASPPFVGRAEEIEQLRAAYAEARAGNTRAVLVYGESGVGKSALVRQFLDEPRDPSPVVLAGRCYERESVPYKALDGVIDVLSKYMRRLQKVEAAAILPLRAGLLQQVFPVLGRVEVVAAAPRPAHGTLDPQELRARVFAALRELLTRIAERQPLIVAIDDLQWTDADSLLMLSELLRPPEPPPLLFIATVRTATDSTEPLRVLDALPGDVRKLVVQRLAPRETRQLAMLLIEATAPQHRASADSLAKEADGHPLFLGELLHHLLEKEAHTPGQLRLEDALWSRILRLPPIDRTLLAIISVAGRPVAQETLALTASLEVDETLRHVAILRAAKLVRSTGARGVDTIEPYHDRVREAVISHLESADQIRYHERLAVALEAAGRVDPEVLAIHWQGAGRTERAAELAAQAAEQAAEALAFERAARLFRLALNLRAPDAAPVRELRVKLGHALVNAGRGADAADAYREAIAGANAAEALDLQRRVAEHLLRSGHIDRGLDAIGEALSAVDMSLAATPARAVTSLLLRRLLLRLRGLSFRERDESQVSARELTRIDLCWAVSTALGMVDSMRGFEFATRHLLLALRAGEPYRIARALAVEACVSSTSGEPARKRVDRLVSAAAELADRIHNPHAQAMALTSSAFIALFTGRWREARDKLETVLPMLRDRCTGVWWEINTGRSMLVTTLYFLGEAGELRQRTAEYLLDAQRRGDLYAETILRTGRSNFAWLIDDKPTLARQHVDEALQRWSKQGFHLEHYYELLAHAQADLYEHNGDAAWRRINRCWAPLRASLLLRMQLTRVETHFTRARAAIVATCNGTIERDLLGLASSDARRIERERMSWAMPLATVIRAGIAGAQGNLECRAELLEAAEQQFEAADMGLHRSAARRRRGELLGGDAGRALIESADAWMSQRQIVRPDRIAALLVPGAGRTEP